MIFSLFGCADMELLIGSICKIKDTDIRFFLSVTADKGKYVFLHSVIVDPGEALLLIVRRIKCRCFCIKMIQCPYKSAEAFLYFPLLFLRKSMFHIFKRCITSVFLSQKDGFAAHVRHKIPIEQHQVLPLHLFVAVHTADQAALTEIDPPGIYRQDIPLAILINTALCQFIMIRMPRDRISGQIIQHLPYKIHIRRKVKTEAFLLRSGHMRKIAGFRRDRDHSRMILMQHGIHLTEKCDAFQILHAAVHIRHPFSGFTVIIQIEHRSRIQSRDTIEFVFLGPMIQRRQQIRSYHCGTQIKLQHTGTRIDPASGIRIFIKCCAVKIAQTVIYIRKITGCPCQDHTNPCLVHRLHKTLIIFSGTKTGCRGKEMGCMIARIRSIRIFHHRHQLHMRVAHSLQIVSKAIHRLRIFHKSFRHFFHGYLINIHRTVIKILFLFRCLFVFPIMGRPIGYDRYDPAIFLYKLFCKRIGFEHRRTTMDQHFICITCAVFQSRNKQFKDPGILQPVHRIFQPVPVIKSTDYTDTYRIWCPHTEYDTAYTTHSLFMRSHIIVHMGIPAGQKALFLFFRQYFSVYIGITELTDDTIQLLSAFFLFFRGQITHILDKVFRMVTVTFKICTRHHTDKESRFVRPFHRNLFFYDFPFSTFCTFQIQIHAFRSGQVYLHQCLTSCRMSSQKVGRPVTFTVNHFLDLCPIHQCIQFLIHSKTPVFRIILFRLRHLQ